MNTERNPAIHQARFVITACLMIIATILGWYIWPWLAVALWVVVGAYAAVVLWAAGEAAWKASR